MLSGVTAVRGQRSGQQQVALWHALLESCGLCASVYIIIYLYSYSRSWSSSPRVELNDANMTEITIDVRVVMVLVGERP